MEKSKQTSQEEFLEKQFSKFFDEYYLNNFQRTMAMAFIKKNVGTDKSENCKRVRSWLLNKINSKRSASTEGQKGCPDIIPGLSAYPFWYVNYYLAFQIFSLSFIY